MSIRGWAQRRLRRTPRVAPVLPRDPRSVIAGDLDPVLISLRAALVPHRRRLWLRRLVRRGWIALACVAIAELVVWTVARFIPLESAPALALAIPVLGVAGWLVVGIRA